jgi:hypothetical protein
MIADSDVLCSTMTIIKIKIKGLPLPLREPINKENQQLDAAREK